MKITARWILPILIITGLAACNSSSNTDENATSPLLITQSVSGFSEDSAYAFIEKQLSFGFRIPGTQAQKLCANYLQQQLMRFADTTYRQELQGINPRNGKSIPIINLVGSFNPLAEKRILLASHWDSRPSADMDTERKDEPILAANDGASGVAVLLEIARNLSSKKPDIGIDIIFFDAEDLGISSIENSFCLGSQAWAKTPHVPNYKAYAGILLDMVGGKNAKFVWEAYSAEYANFVLNHTWGVANELGYGNIFQYQSIGPIIDDHKYVYDGTKIPMIDIIQYDENNGFAPYWHTHDDNLESIDKGTLKAVGNTIHHVIFNQP